MLPEIQRPQRSVAILAAVFSLTLLLPASASAGGRCDPGRATGPASGPETRGVDHIVGEQLFTGIQGTLDNRNVPFNESGYQSAQLLVLRETPGPGSTRYPNALAYVGLSWHSSQGTDIGLTKITMHASSENGQGTVPIVLPNANGQAIYHWTNDTTPTFRIQISLVGGGIEQVSFYLVNEASGTLQLIGRTGNVLNGPNQFHQAQILDQTQVHGSQMPGTQPNHQTFRGVQVQIGVSEPFTWWYPEAGLQASLDNASTHGRVPKGLQYNQVWASGTVAVGQADMWDYHCP